MKGVLVDLGDQHAIDAAWEDASSMGLPIPYLVNNAGPPSTTDVSVVEGLRLAVGSYVAVTEDWLGRHAADASSMTFTSSVAGNFFVGPTTDWYPTAKAGIAGYMRHCAVELRGRPRSNGVAPTGVVTRREMSSRSSSYPLERRFSLLPTIPITGNVPLGSCCKNSASIIVPQRWVTKDNVSLRVRSPRGARTGPDVDVILHLTGISPGGIDQGFKPQQFLPSGGQRSRYQPFLGLPRSATFSLRY